MDRIGVRELRQNASKYLDRVKAGESLEVTERGNLIALLVPPTPSANAREALIAAGRLIPATRARSFPLPARIKTTLDSAEVISAMREERL